jgi:hypothetical protein
MRKIAMIAIAVTALFGVVAIAQASNTYTVTVATVSPKKAGTALKPKPITINFGYQVAETTPGTRPATTSDYVIAFGKQIKSHRAFFKGNKVCTVAQAGYTSGQAPACPATAKAGSGTIKNQAGLSNDKTSIAGCDLGLTLYVGDGKTVPAASNDGIPVKNDLVIAIKNRPPLICPLTTDAALPAGLVTVTNGTALKFHVKEIPFQHPQPGTDNAVISVVSSVGKTVKVRQKVGGVFKLVTRGLFETIGCKSGAHKVNVQFTPSGGGAPITATKPAPCTK